MDHIVTGIKHHTAWLYNQIYENHYFFIDLWSIVHCWSGFVVFTLLLVLHYKRPWMWLVIYLTTYEIVEILMLYVSLHIFNPETIKDQFTDIFVGIFGGLLSYLFAYQKSRIKFSIIRDIGFEALFVAMTFAFLWVGQPYFFFFESAENDPFSLTTFFQRLLFVYLLLRLYCSHKSLEDKVWNRWVVFTLTYFVLNILLAFFAGIYTFEGSIDLSIADKLLLFNSSIFVFQLWFPFLAIMSYEVIYLVLDKSGAEFGKKINVSSYRFSSEFNEMVSYMSKPVSTED